MRTARAKRLRTRIIQMLGACDELPPEVMEQFLSATKEKGTDMRPRKFTRKAYYDDFEDDMGGDDMDFDTLCQQIAGMTPDEREDLMAFIKACDTDDVGADSKRTRRRKPARDDDPMLGTIEDRRAASRAYDEMPRSQRHPSFEQTFVGARNIRIDTSGRMPQQPRSSGSSAKSFDETFGSRVKVA